MKKYFTLRPAGQGVVERAGLLSKLQSAGDIVAACSGLDWRTTDDRPITARSPSQNGYIERLIGSIRRECFEHVIMLGEGRLRRILKLYADYHNGVRTQLSDAADPDLVSTIRSAVDRSGVRPELLCVGIPTAALRSEDDDDTRDNIGVLTSMGILVMLGEAARMPSGSEPQMLEAPALLASPL